jgi:hypothetical protein
MPQIVCSCKVTRGAGEFSPRKSYRRFLRRHKTTRKAGRAARRGLKAGIGALYSRL